MTLVTVAAAAPAASADAVDAAIDRMSRDERVAQLVFIGFNGRSFGPELDEWVSKKHVGGVVLFAHNIASPPQVRHITAAIASAGGIRPPFIAVDQEGGVVRRLESCALPSAMALAAGRSPELAERAGLSVATALRDLGFTMNFAPVLDVLPPGGHGPLETRAFGDDAELISKIGSAYIRGHLSAGVLPVAKHFPGIGSAGIDSHDELPVVDLSRDALFARDLLPFRRAIADGLPALMTGHVALPRITGHRDLAATLSAEIMTVMLRDQLRFGGVIISDALQMKSVSRERRKGNAAVAAFLAGCDMLLALGGNSDRQEVFDALLGAYSSGVIPEIRMRQSLRRILLLKARTGSPARGEPPCVMAAEVAKHAVTVSGDPAILAAIARRRPLFIGGVGALHSRLGGPDAITLPAQIDDEAALRLLASAAETLGRAEVWLAVAQTDDQWRLIRLAAERFGKARIAYVNLGSPYRTIRATRSASVFTYSSSAQAQAAAFDVLTGSTKAAGRLPVGAPASNVR